MATPIQKILSFNSATLEGKLWFETIPRIDVNGTTFMISFQGAYDEDDNVVCKFSSHIAELDTAIDTDIHFNRDGNNFFSYIGNVADYPMHQLIDFDCSFEDDDGLLDPDGNVLANPYLITLSAVINFVAQYNYVPPVETIEDVIFFRNGVRHDEWKFYLYDKNFARKKELKNVESFSGACRLSDAVHTTGRATFAYDPDIDLMDDYINVVQRFYFSNDIDYEDYSWGWYLLRHPIKKEDGKTIDCDLYDCSLLLQDAPIENKTIYATDTNIILAVDTLLQAYLPQVKRSLEPSIKTPATKIEVAAGDSVLETINKLLLAIGYCSLYVDPKNNVLTTNFLKNPLERPLDHDYKTDKKSIIYRGSEEDYDIQGIPNKWVGYASVNESVLKYVFTNINPASPTSTVNRGITRKVVNEYSDAVDHTTLQKLVEQQAFNDNMIFRTITYKSATNPFHGVGDMMRLTIDGLGEEDDISENIYQELEYGFDARGDMTHKVGKVYNLL